MKVSLKIENGRKEQKMLIHEDFASIQINIMVMNWYSLIFEVEITLIIITILFN